MHFDKLHQRIQIEQYLNRWKYQDVGFGDLCCHTVNKLYMQQVHYSGKKIFSDWLWVLSRISFRAANKGKAEQTFLLYPNGSERAKAMFEPIAAAMQTDAVCYMALDDFYSNVPVGVFLKWLWRTLGRLVSYVKIVRQCNRTFHCYSNKQAITLLHTMLLQTFRYEASLSRITQSRAINIVVDLDRGLFQAPIMLASRRLKRNAITLVHGIILPPYLYVPAVASHVFCWGQFHIDFFKGYNAGAVQYFITGNTAFKTAATEPVLHKPSIAGNFLQVDGKKVITYISQNFVDQSQFSIIDTFCQAVSQLNDSWQAMIKPHPADDINRITAITTKYAGVTVMDRSVTLADAMAITDLFMVVNSNFAFDAILASKPVFFWHVDAEKAGLANLFIESANACLVEDAAELVELLQRCTAAGIEQAVNLPALKSFAKQYCAYTHHDSARIIRQTLLQLES